MLKSSGPRRDPYGTPDSKIWNISWTLVTFADCF